MTLWNKLLEVNIEDKERFLTIFSQTVKEVQNNSFKFQEVEEKDYFIVIEENRMNSICVHIVPKQVYSLFKELQQSTTQFLGFSVLAGKHNNKEVRVSCFGIECGLLGKALR